MTGRCHLPFDPDRMRRPSVVVVSSVALLADEPPLALPQAQSAVDVASIAGFRRGPTTGGSSESRFGTPGSGSRRTDGGVSVVRAPTKRVTSTDRAAASQTGSMTGGARWRFPRRARVTRLTEALRMGGQAGASDRTPTGLPTGGKDGKTLVPALR